MKYIIALITFLLAPVAYADDIIDVGDVISSVGDVVAKNSNIVRSVKSGGDVFVGDVIIVPDNAVAAIQLLDGRQVYLRSSTTIQLVKKTIDNMGNITIDLFIQRGGISVINPEDTLMNKLKVKTKDGVISPESGKVFAVQGEEGLDVSLVKGEVDVFSTSGEALKMENQYTKINIQIGERLPPVVKLTAAEIEQLDAEFFPETMDPKQIQMIIFGIFFMYLCGVALYYRLKKK